MRTNNENRYKYTKFPRGIQQCGTVDVQRQGTSEEGRNTVKPNVVLYVIGKRSNFVKKWYSVCSC